jgi:hypothetical protein
VFKLGEPAANRVFAETDLLRARRERPRHCRAAKQRDELAAFHGEYGASLLPPPAGVLAGCRRYCGGFKPERVPTEA